MAPVRAAGTAGRRDSAGKAKAAARHRPVLTQNDIAEIINLAGYAAGENVANASVAGQSAQRGNRNQRRDTERPC